MENPEGAGQPKPPGKGLVWFTRVLCWLCWLGMVGASVGFIAASFDLFPKSWIVRREEGDADLIGSSLVINDPAHPDATRQLLHDPLFIIANLVPLAFFIWALWSARQIFVGVGRGDYFGR